MSAYSTLRVLLRRWYVTVFIAVIAAAMFVSAERMGGVYTTTPVVAFSAPGGKSFLPNSGIDNDNVIGFALTVAQELNQGRPVERYASDDAPLYGAGVRQGVRIGVPSVGGQWSASYSAAEITIQIVGRDRGWVEAQQKSLLQQVSAVSSQAQAETSAAPTEHITSRVVPLSTQIEWISSGHTATAMAALALAAAAAVSALGGAVLLDRALLARKNRRRNAEFRPAKKRKVATK
ncbi:hypothetical protein [Gryllotalpicola protaetiae]|uniref:Uncharacterized protein n=1 Tax=Gryllotalpicola protaetiae TaxID=2419771 RepID=A0A387BQD4_9MICO|nr:hypothetical protein [Gryllotalpicola protaetiae]AYG03186.1 hypothetical protein D7I44_06345 [Gryllotalpicola protaetiae]